MPGAPEHIAAARAGGMRVAFVTNNASRPPAEVAAHLRELGVEAGRDRRRDVGAGGRSGAGRAARPGARVVVLGGPGLADAVAEAGLVPGRGARTTPRRWSPATDRTSSGARSCGRRSASETACGGSRPTPT